MIDFEQCNKCCNGLNSVQKVAHPFFAAIGFPKATPWLLGKTPVHYSEKARSFAEWAGVGLFIRLPKKSRISSKNTKERKFG